MNLWRSSAYCRLLERTGRVKVIGSTTEPEEAVAALTADPPDVCFLDIQMPRLNGFEVLARLPSQPIVIFTTAYDEYALKAFGVNTIDYLLKPVEPESLERALNKVERLRGAGQLTPPDLEALLRQLAESLREPARISRPDCVAFGRPALVHRPRSRGIFLCRGQADIRGIGGQGVLRGLCDCSVGEKT